MKALLLLAPIFWPAKVDCLSLCYSRIFVNDNAFFIQTDEVTEVRSVVQKFCNEHVIGVGDCRKVLEYHMTNCFPDQPLHLSGDEDLEKNIEKSGQTDELETRYPTSEKTSEATPQNTAPNDAYEKETENLGDSTDRPALLGSPEKIARIDGIDYSQRLGPVLIVEIDGIKHSLQKYFGETVEGAVRRFCGMTNLNTENCQFVQTNFLALFKKEENLKEVSDNLKSGTTDQKSSAHNHGIESPSSSIIADMSEIIKNKDRQADAEGNNTKLKKRYALLLSIITHSYNLLIEFNDFIIVQVNALWRWIALIVILLFIIRERQDDQ